MNNLINLVSEEDLLKLKSGDIVKFGIWEEQALVHSYQGLRPNELFLLSRFPMTGVENMIGIIYESIDNLRINSGYLDLRPSILDEDLKNYEELMNQGLSHKEIIKKLNQNRPSTADGIFHYGINLVCDFTTNLNDKDYENPEKFREFDEILKQSNL